MPLSCSVRLEDENPSRRALGLEAVTERLRAAREQWRRGHARHAEYGEHGFPSRHALGHIVDSLSAVLFPIRLGPAELTVESEDAFVQAALLSALPLLASQVRMELGYREAPLVAGEDTDTAAQRIISTLANRLPDIRRVLDTDIEAAYLGDPDFVASTVVHLCARSAGFQTGATIDVNGGLYMGF